MDVLKLIMCQKIKQVTHKLSKPFNTKLKRDRDQVTDTVITDDVFRIISWLTIGGQSNSTSTEMTKAAHLGQEPVHIDSLKLAKAVDPEDTLDVVGGVPGGVEDDDPVGCHQVDAKRASSCGNEEQTTSGKV